MFFNFLDVNECAEHSSLCAPLGTCINTMGSFKCICPRGYVPDETNTICVDDGDESTPDLSCDVRTCL